MEFAMYHCCRYCAPRVVSPLPQLTTISDLFPLPNCSYCSLINNLQWIEIRPSAVNPMQCPYSVTIHPFHPMLSSVRLAIKCSELDVCNLEVRQTTAFALRQAYPDTLVRGLFKRIWRFLFSTDYIAVLTENLDWKLDNEGNSLCRPVEVASTLSGYNIIKQ